MAERRYRAEGLAVPQSIERLHRLLDDVGADNPQVPEDDVAMLETAVIEIAGNLVKHGRPPGRVEYCLEIAVEDDRLVGRLSDSGEELPDGLPLDQEADLMAESGRGLFLADAVLDELRYRRTDESNVWEMTKRFDGSAEH